MYITWIKRKRYSKNIFLVGFDDGSRREFIDETVAKYGLKAETEIENTKLKEIILEDEKRRVIDTSFNLLSYSPRSIKELTERLKRKHFAKESIDKAIDRLKSIGYINDETFAQRLAQKRKQQLKGPKFIQHELLVKGINGDTMRESVSQVYSKDEERAAVSEIVDKKLKTMKDVEKTKMFSRLSGFLIRQGFSNDVIIDVLRKKIKNIEIEEN